jgi:hypothetical protein
MIFFGVNLCFGDRNLKPWRTLLLTLCFHFPHFLQFAIKAPGFWESIDSSLPTNQPGEYFLWVLILGVWGKHPAAEKKKGIFSFS